MDKCMISVELLKILQNNPPALAGFGVADLWVFEGPGELSWWSCCPSWLPSLLSWFNMMAPLDTWYLSPQVTPWDPVLFLLKLKESILSGRKTKNTSKTISQLCRHSHWPVGLLSSPELSPTCPTPSQISQTTAWLTSWSVDKTSMRPRRPITSGKLTHRLWTLWKRYQQIYTQRQFLTQERTPLGEAVWPAGALALTLLALCFPRIALILASKLPEGWDCLFIFVSIFAPTATITSTTN